MSAAGDEPASRYVSANNVRVHYRMYNPEAAFDRTILLIHGLWAHCRWWDHIAPRFTDRYRVVAMDLSGMGDSDCRTAYTLRGFAEEVRAIIHDCNLAPTTIVAHSFGGNVAAHACHLYPEAIDRAILIDAHLFTPDEIMPSVEALSKARIKPRVYARPEDAIERYRLIPQGGFVDPALLEHIAITGLREAPDGWRWKFDSTIHPLLADDPGRVIPSGLRTPVDIIYGASSSVVSPTSVRNAQAFFNDCGVPIAISGSDHHVLLERPAELVAALQGLMARPVRPK